MNYLILGTGGTGGCIGGYLADNGYDVTFFARGEHLKAINEKGLTIHSSRRGVINLKNVKAYDYIDGKEKFDVIFVCVKGYSLREIIDTIIRASHDKTVVIPVLNTLNADEKLSEALPGISILGGCIYVTGYISAPGEITQGNEIFRVVFGPSDKAKVDMELLQKIQKDLVGSKIDGIISGDIKRDVFRKFSFTSAFVAAGAYFDVSAGEMQKDGECRDMFIALLKELVKVANVLNIDLDTDLVDENLKILAGLDSSTTASMQRDMKAGKNSEKDELILDVVRIADKYGIYVPNYKKSCEKICG